MAGRLPEERPPVLVGVLAGQVGQLVDEALDDEPVLGRAHRAPEAERDPEVLVDPLDPHVGDVVRQVAEGGHRRVVDRAGGREALLDEDAGPHHAREPGGGLALGVERRAEHVVGGRPVEAVGEVVLAGPHDLHGPAADRLGRLERIHHEVALAAPAEPAAEQRRVDRDALGREPRQAAGHLERAARVLGGDPHRARVRRDVGRRVHGLHARVLEIRHLVGRLERLAAGLERLLVVAVVPRDLARIPPRRPRTPFPWPEWTPGRPAPRPTRP